eukprot:1187407-Prorocentrum_minimum.AAC.3
MGDGRKTLTIKWINYKESQKMVGRPGTRRRAELDVEFLRNRHVRYSYGCTILWAFGPFPGFGCAMADVARSCPPAPEVSKLGLEALGLRTDQCARPTPNLLGCNAEQSYCIIMENIPLRNSLTNVLNLVNSR